MLLTFDAIAGKAGFTPEPSGKLNLPATQESADALANASTALLPEWEPGQEPLDVVLTGPGPVWGYLCIAHALHGRVRSLQYAAPNTKEILVFGHGV